MKITISTTVNADLNTVWNCWNNPNDIKQWNTASEDWHTTQSMVDLREGGKFTSRMEAKDGSMGFDFAGTYTKVDKPNHIEYVMDDDRQVTIDFKQTESRITVTETFDAEEQHDSEFQKQGWQSILDNFARHVENK
ncbi:SRPBCC domain-containing protein [Kangiella koreensis]|uniref:Activator of Hsp90 ATPase 1 family protein n=1 Tax=Kangiella koreensis (strain DSM 16069 / JCM 12317 / KCTC 12182 / SW-125) TaxID=523791 RepID=C7R9Q9_KANKD|nr:SRPBCC domain-containing protein [Kangiella koreensis]ACV27928.1 Activator of Hsp90 ATPase 1 family protein [Kangiella koreensis DSM 16069]